MSVAARAMVRDRAARVGCRLVNALTRSRKKSGLARDDAGAAKMHGMARAGRATELGRPPG